MKIEPGWKVILTLILLTTACSLVGLGKILNLLFPAGCLGVGLYLYKKYTLLYLGFTWWIFFLTPFVRRYADYKSGFTDPSPMLLAPMLVALVSIQTFYRHLPKAKEEETIPFILAILGVVYGYLISMVSSSPVTATVAFLSWFTPLIFSFHLYVNWRSYPEFSRNIERNFIWGVLVTGMYGVYQYLIAPEWDKYWLIQTGLFTSMGDPEPKGMRVWSTMNSPLPFACVMSAGLMLLFITKSPLKIPASAFGYLSILLTSVRTAWLGWFLAFVLLTISLKSHLQIKVIISVATMSLMVIPLVSVPPFSEMISARMASLSNVKGDHSLNDRQELYERTFDEALVEYMGRGIGSSGPGFDSGILDLLLSLGWMGSIPYISGLLLMLYSVYQSREISSDGFATAARSISTSMIPMLAGGSVMVALAGVILWGFLGMSLAAHKYYCQKRREETL